MIDFGFDKIALIGAVALIVIGPEKLPKVARTAGHLLGKARRYVADVKAEVSRSIELDELKKMKTQFEDAARDVETSVRTEVNAATAGLQQDWDSAGGSNTPSPFDPAVGLGYGAPGSLSDPAFTAVPSYTHPKKNWRLKRGRTPQWYKQRNGIRTQALSGAARVARFRPRPLNNAADSGPTR
jgi:sec-independent protein translocase protein TatB